MLTESGHRHSSFYCWAHPLRHNSVPNLAQTFKRSDEGERRRRDCKLSVASCELSVDFCQLRVASCQLVSVSCYFANDKYFVYW